MSPVPSWAPPTGPVPVTPEQLVALERERQASASAVAALQQAQQQPASSVPDQYEQKYLAEREEQARLERIYGKAGTIGLQFTRGALDYVTSGAALGGLGAEALGEATGTDWLRDFGRDFGKSAQGGELINAYMSLPGMMTATAGLENEAVTDFEKSARFQQEQHDAWPMLSGVSHMAGSVAAGLGAGSAVTAHAGLGTLARAAAVEGAGFGAQAGYAKNASLRDVATSALIGAAIGGGLTYGVGKGAQYLQARRARAAELTDVFGTAPEAAARAGVTVEEAGGREAQSVMATYVKLQKAAKEAAEAASENGAVREQVYNATLEKLGAELSEKVGAYKPGTWAQKEPGALQKWFRRTELLDEVSDDVSRAAQRLGEHRPGLDVALDAARLAKLTKKTADAPAAIGQLQTRVGELMSQVPKSAEGDALRFVLRDASSRLLKSELPAAMKDAHELVRVLGKASINSTDDLTRSYAERAAQSLADDLSGEAFGDAGKLYSQLMSGPGKGFAELGDKALVRDALRTMMGRGQLPDIVRAEGQALMAANDAAAKLTGQAANRGIAAEVSAAERLMAKAEAAVTLDGGPLNRVFDYFKDKASSKISSAIGTAVGGVVGGWPGAMAGNIVAGAVQKRIGPLLEMLKGIGSKAHLPHVLTHAAEHAAREKAQIAGTSSYLGSAKHASLSIQEKHEQNSARTEALELAATDHPELQEGAKAIDGMATGLGVLASGDAQEKLATLRNDLIKPQSNIRGKAYEVLSSEDLRKNNAMWEATVDPMSVYDDLAAGSLDYDKLSYAWKQYPGLLTASQMALVDIVHSHLGEEERANIPEHVLGQLDLAFQMEGGLTKSLDRGMSKRIDAANQQLAQQTPQNRPQGQLKLPGAKPTPVQRIGGNV